MSARILDGKWVRDQILSELVSRVDKVKQKGRPPGLAVVLVGHDPASEIYVRNKIKACADLGIYSERVAPPDTVTTEELLAIIEGLNQREEIDGILVQTPLPAQVDKQRIFESVVPDKDVDGFHPVNVGKLVSNSPALRPCTPSGIIEMLRRYQIPIAGRRAVIVGRSDIVGKPMALLLLHQNATVTICHSKTPDLAGECHRADILVAAIGKPAYLTANFIRPGATVIDVGMNRKPDGKLIGDVDPEAMKDLSGAYTPVPGGVGPLTIAMLMANTLSAAETHLCSG